MKGKYQGALVRCWETGLYMGESEDDKVVVHGDLNSMYVSIFILLNLSPESCWLISRKPYTGKYRFDAKRGIVEFPDDRVGQLTIGINKNDGVTRAHLIDLLEERKKLRALPFSVERESEQLAIKLEGNALYGYQGLEYSRFGIMFIAAAATAVGRFIMARMIALGDKLGVMKLECDTDGKYDFNDVMDNQELINNYTTDLRNYFADWEYANCLNVGLKEYNGMLIYKMKNYILKDGFRLKFKGSGFHGRHMPPLCGYALHRFAKAIFNRKNLQNVWSEFTDLKKFPLKDFTMSVGFNKRPEDYKKGTLYSKLVAKLKDKKFWGNDVFYVKCVDGYYPLGVLSDQELKHRLDYKYYRARLREIVKTRLIEPSQNKKLTDFQ